MLVSYVVDFQFVVTPLTLLHLFWGIRSLLMELVVGTIGVQNEKRSKVKVVCYVLVGFMTSSHIIRSFYGICFPLVGSYL